MGRMNQSKIAAWLERRTGMISSTALFVALFFLLAAKAYRQEHIPPFSQPIRVVLQSASEQESQPVEEATPVMPEVAATQQQLENLDQEPQQEEQPMESEVDYEESTEQQQEDPGGMEIAELEPSLPEPMFLISDEGPQNEQIQEESPDFEAARERAQAMAQELESEKFEIRKFLMREQLNVRASEFDINTLGEAEGAIRTFDITNVPEMASEYVFTKYGIRIVKQRMDGTEDTGFLNAAKTQRGVYTNRPGVGVFEVFQISQRAQIKMGELELQAIKARGMNPKTTQVQEVVFSVGQIGGDWDLIIREFKARVIE